MSEDPMSADGLDIGIESMIRDEPGNRVRFRVEAADDPDQIEMRLEVADHITWWKSVSYFMRADGMAERFRIETKNQTKSAEQLISSANIVQLGRIELWKGGFSGWGAFVAALDLNTWANRGRRFVFRWEED
jgi:hypothetical protein